MRERRTPGDPLWTGTPWQRDRYRSQKEDYIRKLIPLITETNQIVCIAGIRRSGKIHDNKA